MIYTPEASINSMFRSSWKFRNCIMIGNIHYCSWHKILSNMCSSMGSHLLWQLLTVWGLAHNGLGFYTFNKLRMKFIFLAQLHLPPRCMYVWRGWKSRRTLLVDYHDSASTFINKLLEKTRYVSIFSPKNSHD